MKTTKVFKSGNSQAVRLPKGFQTDETDFIIQKIGKSIVLTPCTDPWKTFDQGLSEFSNDFFEEGRKQPSIQEREEF